MISFPFESKNIGSDSSPKWDRAITAEMERDFNKLCWTNGVFIIPATSLMVEALTGMKVKVNPGGCHIEGARAYEGYVRTFTLAPSSSLPRIDRVILRFDTAEDKRNIDIYIKEGAPGAYPSPPDLIRQPNYYELVLADVRVPAGATDIQNKYIKDQRFNNQLCGAVVPAIPHQSETERLWGQIRDSIQTVEDALDKTTAMKLQNQIDERVKYADKPMLLFSKCKEDIDTLTVPGFYSLRNCPNGPRGNSRGALIVVKADLSTSDELTDTIQIYIDSKNTIFTRHSIDKNSWTDWEFVFPDISTETKNAFKAIGWRE